LKFRDLPRTQDYLQEVSQIAEKLDRGSIDGAIKILYEAWKSDNQIFTIGNGGSASTATHFACDLNKWVSDEAARKFRAFSLVDNIPLVSALTNDNGWGDIYYEQLRNFFRK
jgi:D-sedoheptulose 7-phosphate isomerase